MPPLRTETQLLGDRIEALEQIIAELVAERPSDGKGRWRQGTSNQRNLYVHQGDDEVGKPVGQMYSAHLAALVCEALNKHVS